ncbi:MAG TPA: CbiQ family ECF transporter T component [Candidatus Krumholzibacteria bacterium]|nr:CbiQ family ECF transporter T component [Candidatus Krumholzibacteria bacterium]HPD72667.1 CbiQ family ECF transporter T component [Candidatus Krumholzibacteria bacterium]HRY40401.1 CbiQ family ECF transporter T component [Candidatus Krumholzibacteria bacterium]
MIPAAGRAWRPVASLPLRRSHPAARLAAGLLAVLSALFWPPLALVPLACLLGACLWRSGWRPAGAASLLRAWLPVVLVVLVAHTVSAVDAAPLGRPTWLGLSRGVLALCRLALVIAAGALLLRLLPLPDLTVALTWWLRPLEPLGVDTGHLGVTLAVALGTAPRTHAEAARIRACLRLRRADPRRRRRGLHLRELLLVVPPVMEGLARRAETLPLALAGRLPAEPTRPPRLPWAQGLLLIAWAGTFVGLVLLA